MITFSDPAKEKINSLIKGQDSSTTGIRIKFNEDKRFELSLRALDQLTPEEEPLRDKLTHFFVEYDGFMLIVDSEGQKNLGEGTIEYSDGGVLSGFFEYTPRQEAPPKDTDNPLVQEVQTLLDNEINPGLAMHGGRAELLNVLNDKVYLRFGGGCQGCSMIDVTVKQGIESRIKEIFPQIKGVIDETDHASGSNPYFQG